MEQIKHNSLTFDKTIDMSKVIGKKVLTNEGKKIGKIKGINLHPTDLTIEGIRVDTGMFDVNKYIDGSYIKSITYEGAVLKTTPVTEYRGLEVYDSLGKKIGKVTDVSRSKMTNSLNSIKVKLSENGNEVIIMADYVAACGTSCMLKEPWELKAS